MKRSQNFAKMVERKRLIREGTPEAEEKANAILNEVLENGGISAEETYALLAY